MAEGRLRFYNMLAHLVNQNKLYEENVAVKKVWEKDHNTFFDLYFYRSQKSYVIDGVFIHDLLDLSTEKFYNNKATFLEDFYHEGDLLPTQTKPDEYVIDKKLFASVDVDLIIMIFMANCCDNFISIKKRIIHDYIAEYVPATRSLTKQYIDTYLKSIKPNKKNFYEALEFLQQSTPYMVENLFKETLKICLSDGQLHYVEKFYLAEFLQCLREQGIEPDVGL